MRTPSVLSSKDDKDKAVVAWSADIVRAIKELQADVVRAIKELHAIPFRDGVRLDNVTVGVADTLIKHKLGRAPRGFWCLNMSADTVVWQPVAPTTSHIHLQSSLVEITTDIWVF